MKCPKCKGEVRTIDSRPTTNGNGVRRRRKCTKCGYKFTTVEREVHTRQGGRSVDAEKLRRLKTVIDIAAQKILLEADD